MAAPKGSQFWKQRSSHGRKPIFADAETLWDACTEYFDWVEANPLLEAKLTSYQGDNKIIEVPKMRAMTMEGLCVFLGIGTSTWADYRNRKNYSEVVTRVEAIMRTQKFTGAAAELLNPNIIARDLGLSDKSQHTTIGKDGGEVGISLEQYSEEEKDLLAKMRLAP